MHTKPPRPGIAALAVLSLLVTTGALAGQRRPVPDVSLLNREGRQVSVRSAVGKQTVVAIYLVPKTAPSERLLEAMKTWAPPIDPRRVLLVVDGESPDAGQWLAAHLPANSEGVPLAFFDLDGRGRAALQVSGGPTLLGIEGGEIRWDLAGVLNDPAALEPVIRNWTTRR
jgi:hypothetical protein